MTLRQRFQHEQKRSRQRLEIEKDREWQQWITTPESSMAILQQPRLGIRPSQRSSEDRLKLMLDDIKRNFGSEQK